MSENKSSMAYLRMPERQLDFVRKNPALAAAVGTLIITMSELKEAEKQAYEMLQNTENFEGMIEDGTKEQLDSFLTSVLSSYKEKGLTTYKDVPEDAMEEIRDKLSDKINMVETIIHSRRDIDTGA